MITIGDLSPEEDAAISAALSTLPPMTDEAVDRVVALWAAMDAQAHDARSRTVAAGGQTAVRRATREHKGRVR